MEFASETNTHSFQVMIQHYSLTLFLAQQLTNQSKSENLVTVTHINAIANSGLHVVGGPTSVSTPEEVDTIMILHEVEVAE